MAVVIDRLDVTRVEDHEASVDFEGSERWELELESGRQTQSFSLSGPLVARRVGGEWKVADYALDGRPLSESFVPFAAEPAGTNGVRLAARGLSLHAQTALFLEAENTGHEPLELHWAALKCCFSGLSRTTIEPGERVVVYTGWAKRLLRARSLRVFVHGRESRSRKSFTFGLHLHPGTREAEVTELRRRPFALWFQLQMSRPLIVVPFLAGVLAWMLAVGNYKAAGALMSLLGGGGLHEGYNQARRGDRRAARNSLAAGLALLAAGIPLFLLNR